MKKRQLIRKGLILISFLLFPAVFFYFSPYLIIYGAVHHIVSGSFIFFILLFLASLFFGRGFCGWVCPAGGLQEACITVQPKKTTGGYWIKFLIWFPWMGTIIFFSIKNGGLTKIDPLFQTVRGLSLSDPESYLVYYFVLILIVSLALKVGKRSFCHHVCWMAPFMILGTRIKNFFKWPSLKLEADSSKCIHCKKCNQECPMSLDVEQMTESTMEHHECILCGACIDSCPKKVISFSFKYGNPAGLSKKNVKTVEINQQAD